MNVLFLAGKCTTISTWAFSTDVFHLWCLITAQLWLMMSNMLGITSDLHEDGRCRNKSPAWRTISCWFEACLGGLTRLSLAKAGGVYLPVEAKTFLTDLLKRADKQEGSFNVQHKAAHILHLENGFQLPSDPKGAVWTSRGCNEITCGWRVEQTVSKTKEVKWKHTDVASISQKWEWEMETEVSKSTDTDVKMICICDITSYVEIGRRRITGPSAVHGNTFVFPLVRLLAVLNLQSPCAED